MDDVRYYVMSSVRENLSRVLGRSRGVGPGPVAQLSHLSRRVMRCCLVSPPGRPARVPEQRVHAHVQHQPSQSGGGALQLHGHTSR